MLKRDKPGAAVGVAVPVPARLKSGVFVSVNMKGMTSGEGGSGILEGSMTYNVSQRR